MLGISQRRMLAGALLVGNLTAWPAGAQLLPEGAEHTILTGIQGSDLSLAATPTSFAVAFGSEAEARFRVLDASAQVIATVTAPPRVGDVDGSSNSQPIVRAWSDGIWLLFRQQYSTCCSEPEHYSGYLARRFDATGVTMDGFDEGVVGISSTEDWTYNFMAISNQAALGQGRLLVHFQESDMAGMPPPTSSFVFRRYGVAGHNDNLDIDFADYGRAIAVTANGAFMRVIGVETTPFPEVDLVAYFHGAAGEILAGPVAVSLDSLNVGGNKVQAFSLPDGGYGVAFRSRTEPWVFRLFNEDGSIRTDLAQIDGAPLPNQVALEVAVGQAGEIVFAWTDGDGIVWARLYDDTGRSLGEKVRVSAQDGIFEVQVAAAPGGRFLTSWLQPPLPRELRGRFLAGPTIFANGFESGDSGDWANTVP